MLRAITLVLITWVAISAAFPLVKDEQTPAQDRILSKIIPPYDVNPHFGFRKYAELRYEPLTLPFFLPPAVPFGPQQPGLPPPPTNGAAPSSGTQQSNSYY